MCTGCISVFSMAFFQIPFLVPRTRSFMLYLNLLTCLLDFRKIRTRTSYYWIRIKKAQKHTYHWPDRGGSYLYCWLYLFSAAVSFSSISACVRGEEGWELGLRYKYHPCNSNYDFISMIQLEPLNYVTQRLGMETTYSECGTGTFTDGYTYRTYIRTNQFNSYRYGTKLTQKRERWRKYRLN